MIGPRRFASDLQTGAADTTVELGLVPAGVDFEPSRVSITREGDAGTSTDLPTIEILVDGLPLFDVAPAFGQESARTYGQALVSGYRIPASSRLQARVREADLLDFRVELIGHLVSPVGRITIQRGAVS